MNGAVIRVVLISFCVGSLLLPYSQAVTEQHLISATTGDTHSDDEELKDLIFEFSKLAGTVRALSYRLEAVEIENERLHYNLEKLQDATKDLLYERFAELYEIAAEDGEYYDDGLIGDEITADALWYLFRAAESGHVTGQLQLGILYDTGYPGLNKSHTLALEWYTKAAMNGLPEAQCYVAMAYHLGKGVNQSDELAIQWYRIAAENEDGIAQNNLGWMLLTGGKSEKSVTPEEEAEAVQWFRRAAELGEPFGKANLGLCYTIGAGGLPINHQIALKFYHDISKKDIERYGTVALNETPTWRSNMMQWFQIAADAGDKVAIVILQIHNITDSSGELFAESLKSNSERAI